MWKVSNYKLEDGTKMISIWKQIKEKVSNITVFREICPGIYKKSGS